MKKRKMDDEYVMRIKSMVCFIFYRIALYGGLLLRVYMTVHSAGLLTRESLLNMVSDSIILASFTQYTFYEYSLKKIKNNLDFMIIFLWLLDFLVNFIEIIK